MLKKIFSYLIPITIFKQKSTISSTIEVTWVNGELVLDSNNTNYSYGSLQRILKKGLQKIGFEKIKSMNHILVLGVAGGSVVKTLLNDVNYKGKITGVEIDPGIISIANTYFQLHEIPNLTIIIDDAFEFVLKTKEKYDLIIIDIFQDTVMPNFLFEDFFTDRLGVILESKGSVLFNTMITQPVHNERNLKYISKFNTKKYKVKSIPRVEEHNELIILEKLS
jgi:spermidine synthase